MRNCTNHEVKTKALIRCAVTAQLICTFVITFVKTQFSREVAHMQNKFTSETCASRSYDEKQNSPTNWLAVLVFRVPLNSKDNMENGPLLIRRAEVRDRTPNPCCLTTPCTNKLISCKPVFFHN